MSCFSNNSYLEFTRCLYSEYVSSYYLVEFTGVKSVLSLIIQNGLIYSYSLRKLTVTKNLQKRQVYLSSYTSQTTPLEGMISPRLLLLQIQRLKDKLSRVLCVLQLSILLIKLTNKTQACSFPSVFLGIINLLTYLPEKFSFIIFFRIALCIFADSHHHTRACERG